MVVYPRWRGEHLFSQIYGLLLFGLSPLARGTRAHGIQSRVSARFIPAGAGNTGSATAAPMTTSVYPRWRGEHEMLVSVNAANTGLSPLARGTHYAFLRLPGFCRFIPAGAGNTCAPVLCRSYRSVYPRWRGEHSNHNLLLINDFLSQSQSTNFIVSHKQHIHYVKEHLIH